MSNSSKLSHNQFLDFLYEKNKHYRDGLITVISEYKGHREYVKVLTEKGEHLLHARSLIEGKLPSISSLIDKLGYLHRRLLESNLHYRNGFFSLKELNGNRIIISTKYGDCDSRIDGLLEGKKPSIKSAINKDEYLVNKLKAKVIEDFDYSLVEYRGVRDKIKVICKKHGLFYVRVDAMLVQSCCPKCGKDRSTKHNTLNPTGWSTTHWERASIKSKNFDSFKVYIIKCWNENEEFYKIGRTYTTLNKRFVGKERLPYNFEVVDVVVFKDAKETVKVETKLKNLNKLNKYKPKVFFRGHGECFSKINKLLWKSERK